ncbi:hypothetical protein Tco_1109513 [Tanacetum coccineum]
MTMEILPEPTSNKLRDSYKDGHRDVSKDFRYSDITYLLWNDEVLKLKNCKKDGYSSFQDKEKYKHVGPKVTSSQEGKIPQDDDKRLDVDDDLKKSQDYIQVKLKGTSSSLKSKDHYTYHKMMTKIQDYEHD